MYRFYHSNSLDLNQIIILDEFAGHHALRVMRIKVNDPLILFNGDGFEYKGQVNGINKKTITLNEDINVQTNGLVLLDYKILGSESKEL